MPDDIFISYARADRERINPIVDAMRAVGVTFWIDEGQIHAATLWSEEIVDAINNCTAMVVVLSDNSTGSDNVVKEVMLASELKKPILPIYLEETEIPRKLQYQLAGIQHLEVYGRDISNLAGELPKSLNRMGVQTSSPSSGAYTHHNVTQSKPAIRLSKKARAKLTIASLCLVAFIVGLTIRPSVEQAPVSVTHTADGTPFHVTELLGENKIITPDSGSNIAISPDGEHVAVVTSVEGQNSLHLRNSKSAKWLTIGEAIEPSNIFFSPDSQWLFFTSNSNGLRAYSLTDGTIQTAVPEIQAMGVAFGNDRLIYPKHYRSGLFLLNRVTQVETKLTTPSSDTLGHFWPQLLPDGKHVMYTDFIPELHKTTVRICALDGSMDEVLISNAFTAKYVSPGYVLFVREGNLMAVKFDKDRNQLSGSPVPMVNDVYVESAQGYGGYSISDNGILVYTKESEVEPLFKFYWVDRKGEESALPLEAKQYGSFDLSHDDSQLAMTMDEANNRDIWVYDFQTGIRTRLTDKTNVQMNPRWVGKDGHSILYVDDVPPYSLSLYDLKQQESQPLLVEQYDSFQPTVSADGHWVVFSQIVPTQMNNLLALNLLDRAKTPVRVTKYNEMMGAISPDGNYVAYQSNPNGKHQIYIIRISDSKNPRQVTINGGESPMWARDGSELFFRNESGLHSVAFNPETGEIKAKSTLVFTNEFARVQNSPGIEPSADGNRFLVLKKADQSTANRLHYIFNFDELLRQSME